MRGLIASGLAVLLVICFAGAWYIAGFNEAVTSVAIGFVINTIAAFLAVMLGVSQLEKYIHRVGIAREFGAVADFWTVPAPKKPWVVIFGGRPSDPSDPELRPSFSTVFAYTKISSILSQLYGETSVTLKNFRDIVDWDVTSTANVVFLGGVVSIPRLKEVFQLLPLHARQEVLDDKTRQIVILDEYAETRLLARMKNGLVTEDHALVARVINHKHGSSLFIVSGNWGAGTGAAVLALTDKAHFNPTGFSQTTTLNEAVVSVKNIIDGEIYKGQPSVDCRSWRAQTLQNNILSEVAQKLCRSGSSRV